MICYSGFTSDSCETVSWFSWNLEQCMPLKVYGHSGRTMILFPCQSGRFYDAQSFGLLQSIEEEFITKGLIRVITVDSFDDQSWCCVSKTPEERAIQHLKYEHYIIYEVIPWLRRRFDLENKEKFISTGCSMGAYHAVNILFHYPDIFETCISLSGILQLSLFVGDDDSPLVHSNTPLKYIKDCQDNHILNLWRSCKIIICAGQGNWEQEMLEDMKQFEQIMNEKHINAWIDRWGHDVCHDWPWWKKQLPYFLHELIPE